MARWKEALEGVDEELLGEEEEEEEKKKEILRDQEEEEEEREEGNRSGTAVKGSAERKTLEAGKN